MLAPYNTFGNNAVVEFGAPTYCNVINVCADQEDGGVEEVEGIEGNGEGNGPNVHLPPTLPTEATTTTVASSTTSTSTSTLTTTSSTSSTATSATTTTTTTTTTTQNLCQSTKKYHPTTKQLHTCTNNNNNFPKLWTASSELVAEYFFDSSVECCAAFYSTGGESSVGEVKECIIEDVCLDTPTGYPLYYLDLDFGICIQQSDDNGGFGEGMINLFNTLEECVSISVLFCVAALYIIGMTRRTNSLSSNVIPRYTV